MPLLRLYPLRGGTQRTQLIDDLLDLAENGKQAAVDEIIDMLDDLHQNGRACRFLKGLKGIPLFELKPASRGGHKGGARVYLAFNEHDEALVLNAEMKAQGVDAPNPAKIMQAIKMLDAHKNGRLQAGPNAKSERWWRP